MPGVSTKTIWAAPSIAMPRTTVRVVWTLRDTIETFDPTSALRSVDLPAFGAPMRAAKPQRVSGAGVSGAGSDIVQPVVRGRLGARGAGVLSSCDPGFTGRFHKPSRRRRFSAASCSAPRFEEPVPSAGLRPWTLAAMRKRGAWWGPNCSTIS